MPDRARRRWAPPPMDGYEPMIVNVALTGAVSAKADNPTVPLTPEEIAADAVACARAGASVVHVHVRDEEGRPVHRRDLYERAVGLIRDTAPDLIVGVTTSSRVDPDPVARMAGLDIDPPPDMASLTLGSFNFPHTPSVNPPDAIDALLVAMQERGIKPELEVFELGMVNTAHALIERGLIGPRPWFNVLLGSMGSAPAFAGTLAAIVERLPADAEWAAAGIGIYQRPMTLIAAAMGGNVRTGLEDNPRSPDGSQWTNARAVELTVDAARLAGRGVATPVEARSRLGLAPAPSLDAARP